MTPAANSKAVSTTAATCTSQNQPYPRGAEIGVVVRRVAVLTGCIVALRKKVGQRRITAMLLKSAKLASKSDLLTQYWLALRTSLTRTWVGETPVNVTECSA